MDVPVARNIRLVIAYDGGGYHGWQRQAGGLPTIQETLEQAILMHAGEAKPERDAFAALVDDDKILLLTFLRALRTPLHPAQGL